MCTQNYKYKHAATIYNKINHNLKREQQRRYIEIYQKGWDGDKGNREM